jgi:hypothetical protein
VNVETPLPPAPRKNLLVVDDDGDFRDAIASLLAPSY